MKAFSSYLRFNKYHHKSESYKQNSIVCIQADYADLIGLLFVVHINNLCRCQLFITPIYDRYHSLCQTEKGLSHH